MHSKVMNYVEIRFSRPRDTHFFRRKNWINDFFEKAGFGFGEHNKIYKKKSLKSSAFPLTNHQRRVSTYHWTVQYFSGPYCAAVRMRMFLKNEIEIDTASISHIRQ
jgi:hypothetical protein